VLTIATSRLWAAVFGAVAVGSLTVHWLHVFTRDPHLNVADIIGTFTACGLLAGIVLVQVFREGAITLHRIQGAISVYLLLGLMWAALYGVIFVNDPQAFSFGAAAADGPLVNRARLIYFSFTTLTTVGYGDIAAVSPVARSMAILEAVIGQLFPAILIARLVSMELYHRQRRFEREQADLDRQAVAREIDRQLREPD
jgi:voltage-gated potassium channel Kch